MLYPPRQALSFKQGRVVRVSGETLFCRADWSLKTKCAKFLSVNVTYLGTGTEQSGILNESTVHTLAPVCHRPFQSVLYWSSNWRWITTRLLNKTIPGFFSCNTIVLKRYIWPSLLSCGQTKCRSRRAGRGGDDIVFSEPTVLSSCLVYD